MDQRNPHGKRIREILTHKGISQVELGKRINRAPSTTNNILNRERIDMSLLEDISLALNHDFVNEFHNVPHKKDLPKKKRNITTVSLSLLDGEIIDVTRNKEITRMDLLEKLETIIETQKVLIDYCIRNEFLPKK